MNRFMTVCILSSFALIQLAEAQVKTGNIVGAVVDKLSRDPMIGAIVRLDGTPLGTSTNIEGAYAIASVPVGTYTARVSYVGYATKVVTSLEVKPGETVRLDISMEEQIVKAQEVVVTARAIRTTEASLIALRRQSITIGDGLSAEMIRRAPDATSADALRRLTGITLVDNKFIFVRGISDRYNQTLLNGTSVSSTDSEKRGFSFDILPSSLLDNTIVVKSATPDLRGDFTGGLVQLNTLEFPEKLSIKISVGSGYNTLTSNKAVFTSNGSSTDWLGYDNGARTLPSMSGDLTSLAKSMSNSWSPRIEKAPLNSSLSLSVGDVLPLNDDEARLGFVAALTYRSGFQRNQKSLNDWSLGRSSTGQRDDYSVLLGALANVTAQWSNDSKISFKNTFNRSGEDQVSRFLSEDLNTSLQNEYTIVSWTQRSTYTGQLSGYHAIPALGDMSIEWKASASTATRRVPDRKEVTYYRELGASDQPFTAAVNQRSWSSLNDRTRSAGVDVTLPLGSSRLKTGVLYEHRRAEYGVRYFNIRPDYYGGISPEMTQASLDRIYQTQNYGEGKFLMEESSKASDSYVGTQRVSSIYGMADLPFEILEERFRVVGGVRYEHNALAVDVPRTRQPDGPQQSSSLNDRDLLPSIQVNWSLAGSANLRFGFSKSVNRPEFREIAATGYYDFITYELVGGNPDLMRSLAKNFDARFEVFPEIGGVIALSVFRKDISQAIEERLIQTATRTRSWFNSGQARNTGFELEARKNLSFLSDWLTESSVMLNYTRVFSDVEFQSVEGNSTETVTVNSHRPMQGQSPYVINAAIQVVHPEWHTALNVLYNRFGRRLDAVGFLAADIFEESRGTVDVTLTQPIGRFEVKFTARNASAQPRVLTRGTSEYERTITGVTYGLQLSQSF